MAGRIKGITIEFDGNTSKLKKAIKEVESDTRAIDRELKAVNRALKFNPTSVDLWRQKQTLLSQKINETKNKLQLLKQQQAQMDASGVDKNSAEYRKLQREIIETESKLKHFSSELRAIGNVKLRALSEEFKQVGAKATELGRTLTQKVTLPLAAIGGVSVKKFAEVDKVMQLTNATMGNSAAQADLLNNAMKDAAANSTYGMNEAATATLNFARAGLTAEEAASALAPAMALAAGEGGDLDTVSGGLVATINGFHGSFDDAATYADVFANACNNSALDVNSLSEAMSVAAPIFSAAGYSVQDAALYMGIMANAGISADVAANSLKTGMARLVEPTAQASEWLNRLGIEITNADGTMKSSVQIQSELHNAFSTLSESEQLAAASAIFGKNQMSPWLALINTGTDDVKKLNKAIGANGTALEMQGQMMDGFGGSIEQLKSGLDVAATSLGEALAPAIGVVVSAIQTLVNWFNKLSPTAQTVVAVIGVIVAAIGPLLLIIGTVASSIGSIMSLVATIGPMIGTIGASLSALAGPIGIAIAVITALVAVGVLLYQNWDTIKAKAQEIWAKIVEVWNGIKEAVSTAVEAIKSVVTTVFEFIKAFIIGYLNFYLTIFKTVWNGIKTVVTTVINSIKSGIQITFNAIKSFIANVWNGIKSTTQTVWNGIKTAIINPIQSAYNTVKGWVDKLKSLFPLKVGKIFSNLKVPKIVIKGGKAPYGIGGLGEKPDIQVKWYAKGGIFTRPTLLAGNGLAGVGEAGPEAVLPISKLQEMVDFGNEPLQKLVANQTNILLAMYEEMKKEKNFKVDSAWAGRYVNGLVR